MSTKSKRKRASAPKAEPVTPAVDEVAEVVADVPAETAVAQADAPQDESACAAVAELERAAMVASVAEPETIAAAASARESNTVFAPESNTGPTIGLASNCTVKDAASFKNELLQLLDEPGSVAIDAKSVERIDTAIMQLLCAFVRDRSQRNASVTWVGVPQPLFDAARLLGVGALLALPQEATP